MIMTCRIRHSVPSSLLSVYYHLAYLAILSLPLFVRGPCHINQRPRILYTATHSFSVPLVSSLSSSSSNSAISPKIIGHHPHSSTPGWPLPRSFATRCFKYFPELFLMVDVCYIYLLRFWVSRLKSASLSFPSVDFFQCVNVCELLLYYYLFFVLHVVFASILI